jgi:Holliday junction resolvase RusA-like endonuclease
LYFKNARTGRSIKNKFKTAHLDLCKGSTQQIRDYVFKENLSKENESKEETQIDGMQYESGQCPKERQGTRSDLDNIQKMLDDGYTPKQILGTNIKYYRYESAIRKAFFTKRYNETPIKRNINVIVHVGESGGGKSHVMTTLNENETYLYTDYSTGGMDFYNGEQILFMDEFRGQIPYNQLLLMLDGYKVPIHARYNNVYSLWTTVHITSVIPPEEWYKNENKRDTYEQLRRRITTIVFHWKDSNGFHAYKKPMAEYTTYEELETEAKERTVPDIFGINNGQDIILQSQADIFDYI